MIEPRLIAIRLSSENCTSSACLSLNVRHTDSSNSVMHCCRSAAGALSVEATAGGDTGLLWL